MEGKLFQCLDVTEDTNPGSVQQVMVNLLAQVTMIKINFTIIYLMNKAYFSSFNSASFNQQNCLKIMNWVAL